jgi:antitoxin (DNA-binding transcriptional repressor) of toxin-antitoxin stability system
MESVNVSGLKNNPSDALRRARKEVVVVMNRDKPDALMVGMSLSQFVSHVSRLGDFHFGRRGDCWRLNAGVDYLGNRRTGAANTMRGADFLPLGNSTHFDRATKGAELSTFKSTYEGSSCGKASRHAFGQHY